MGNECDICEKIDDDSNRRNIMVNDLGKDHRTSQNVNVALGKENLP